MVFLIIDFKRFFSGSWPLTTGVMSDPLPGGGHDAALARGCAPPPLPVAWTGAVAGTSSGADCCVGTVIVCRTRQTKLRHDFGQTEMSTISWM